MRNLITLLLLFNLSYLGVNAQNRESITNECLIKVNDSIIAKGGDYILDNKEIIDFEKKLIDPQNINRIVTIKNPCSHINSGGYKGAHIIYRTKINPFLNLKSFVENVETENSDFKYVKTEIILNKKVIDNIDGYQIEITDNLDLIIVKDKIRKYKLTISIGYSNK